jgi:hypothetical protein
MSSWRTLGPQQRSTEKRCVLTRPEGALVAPMEPSRAWLSGGSLPDLDKQVPGGRHTHPGLEKVPSLRTGPAPRFLATEAG